MLIKFTQGPKAGQTKHVQRSGEVQLLIDAGLAEEVQTNGVSAEDLGVPLHGSQHILPPFVTTVTWGIKPLPYSFDAKPTIVKQYMSEFVWYAMPPKDCPQEIADKFRAELKHWEAVKMADQRQREEASGGQIKFL